MSWLRNPTPRFNNPDPSAISLTANSSIRAYATHRGTSLVLSRP